MNCEEIWLWTSQLHLGAQPVTVPADFYPHIVSCAPCRSSLILVLAPTLGSCWPPLTPPNHGQDSELALASFIEHELAHGSLSAIRTHPRLWRDLMSMRDLAETYRLTRALVDAEQRAALRPLDHTLAPQRIPLSQTVHVQAPPTGVLMRFERSLFSSVLQQGAAVGHREYGVGTSSKPLLLEEHEGFRLKVSLEARQYLDQTCDLEVTVAPPLKGKLVLALGDMEYRVAFDDHGTAVVGAVPVDLLTAPDGPDLVVRVEPATSRWHHTAA